jgi:3-oxoisoapionate decarboxylase
VTGIVRTSLPDTDGLDPSAALAAAAGLGLDGVLYSSLLDVSPTLDRSALRALIDGSHRMRLAAGVGWLNPTRPERSERLSRLGEGNLALGLRRLIESAAAIGLDRLFFVIGTIDERFDRALPWSEQLAGVTSFLQRAAPMLRDLGIRLLIKTHEEIFTAEVVRLVETVGPDVLGVALDPVNVLCRLEDPVAATRRVAPYVGQVHLDDAVMQMERQGIRRLLCPIGEGAIDWRAILQLIPPEVPRWIEMHRAQFAMPAFDRDWLALQPDIELGEYATVLGMAARFGDRPTPWDQARPASRLPATLTALRELSA